MGKSSIAQAAEQAPQQNARVQCVYLEYYVPIGGSQPAMIENKEPWSFHFDWDTRLLWIECRRDGTSQFAWVPFERIKSVVYEKVAVDGQVRKSA